jgi:hypothetical protein
MNRRSLIKNGLALTASCATTKFLVGCNTFNGSLNSISPIYIKKRWPIDSGPLVLQFEQRIFLSSRFLFQLGFSEIGIDDPNSSNFEKRTNLRTADPDFLDFFGGPTGRRATGSLEKPKFLDGARMAEIIELTKRHQIFYHFERPGTYIPTHIRIESLGLNSGTGQNEIQLFENTQGGSGSRGSTMPFRVINRQLGHFAPGLYRFTISTPHLIPMPAGIEVFFVMSELTG